LTTFRAVVDAREVTSAAEAGLSAGLYGMGEPMPLSWQHFFQQPLEARGF
jgi:hypothetical protein